MTSDKWNELRKRLKSDFSVWAVTREEGLELLDELTLENAANFAMSADGERQREQIGRQQRAIEMLLEAVDYPLGYQRSRMKYHAERILKGEE